MLAVTGESFSHQLVASQGALQAGLALRHPLGAASSQTQLDVRGTRLADMGRSGNALCDISETSGCLSLISGKG